MCNHPLPSDSAKVTSEVVSVNSTGKYVDSLGSPRVAIEYNCPSCGEDIEATTYADIRGYSATSIK